MAPLLPGGQRHWDATSSGRSGATEGCAEGPSSASGHEGEAAAGSVSDAELEQLLADVNLPDLVKRVCGLGGPDPEP